MTEQPARPRHVSTSASDSNWALRQPLALSTVHSTHCLYTTYVYQAMFQYRLHQYIPDFEDKACTFLLILPIADFEIERKPNNYHEKHQVIKNIPEFS